MPDGKEAICALSYAQVEAIRRQFARLNPYAEDAVPDTILKSEVKARCFAISAKRYALYDVIGGQLTLSAQKAPSEHGLGHLLDPSRDDHSEEEAEGEEPDDDETLEARPMGRAWIAEAWRWILHEAEGLHTDEPSWLDQRAVTRLTISSPALLSPFKAFNEGKPYSAQVKPSNFMLVAHVASFGHPLGAEPARFRLVAPFEPLASQWPSLPWRNLYDPNGPVYTTSTSSFLGERGEADDVRVQTMRDVLGDHRIHPEAKSLGPDGEVCGRSTVGMLSRRPVNVTSIHHIGEEANRLEEVQAGVIGELGEVLNEYVDPQQDLIRTLVLPFLLKEFSEREIVRRTRVDHKTIARIRKGRSRHQQGTARKLWDLALEIAESQPVTERSPEALALLAEAGARQQNR